MGSAGLPPPWQRGPHLPTVVHSHEITNKQEGVGQHAHCNLKPRETRMSVTPEPAPTEFRSQGHTVPTPYTTAGLLSPTQAHRAARRVDDLTYPHHKFGVAPDGQGLAELKTERRPVCHRPTRLQTSHKQTRAVRPGPRLPARPPPWPHSHCAARVPPRACQRLRPCIRAQ